MFQGDIDYVNFWRAVESEEGFKKHVMANVQDGLKELEKGQTIMFTDKDILTASFNQDPKNFQRIKTFGASRKLITGWIFTKNSPLVPLFKQSSLKMFENGEFRRAQLKWKGPDIISEERTDESEILNIGQLVLPFMIFGIFLVVSIIPLMIECCHKKITECRILHQLLHR